MAERPLTFDQIYRNLDGLTALAVASAEPLHKLPDEMDTAFVKRIVARFMSLESERLSILGLLSEAAD